MKVAGAGAEVLSQHSTLALECGDRLYLNVCRVNRRPVAGRDVVEGWCVEPHPHDDGPVERAVGLSMTAR